MFKFSFGEDEPQASGPSDEKSSDSTAPAAYYSIDNLKARPPRISYTVDRQGLPRRDLFDVRFELMGYDELTTEEQILLGTEDVRENVYEGGLKVWEGANDLIETLSSGRYSGQSVMELGCGAGTPSCFLLKRAIDTGSRCRFVLADYNSAVLRLLTMPNAILTWLAATNNAMVQDPHGEIVLSSELIDEMLSDLSRRGIEIQFVSGAWSPLFSDLVGSPFDLVLASETIYSLHAINDFTDVVERALTDGTALVAAKKVYFGVGGGIVEFERSLDERKMRHEIVSEKGSVGRVVLQVKSQ